MTVMDEVPAVAETEQNGEQPAPLSVWPYRFEVIALNRLTVDHKYQRELTSLADKIGENFNPAMVGTLIVSERKNGKLAIVDGQTRFRGAEKSGVVTELPCLVYVGMSVADEARLFADLQRNRRNIATYQRFRSDLVAGDPMSKDIAAILKGFNLQVGPKKDTDIQSVAALESVWKRDHWIEEVGQDGTDKQFVLHGPDGPSLLQRTINVLQSAWGSDEDARDVYSAEMIRGLARFLQGQGIEDDRTIKRLSNTSPGKLKLRAGMLREGKGGGGHTTTYMADALLTEYSRRG